MVILPFNFMPIAGIPTKLWSSCQQQQQPKALPFICIPIPTMVPGCRDFSLPPTHFPVCFPS